MKKPVQYILTAIFVAAVLCCAAGLFVALDIGPFVRSEIHNLFQGNANLNPDTDLVVVSDIFGRKGYMDNRGNVVIWPSYEEADAFSEGLASVQSGGKFGYIDQNGKFVIRSEFTSAFDFSEGLASVQTGGKYGYIDQKGKIIIQPQFDLAFSFDNGLARVYKNGNGKKSSFINMKGEEQAGNTTIDDTYLESRGFLDGLAAVEDRKANLWGVIDEKGDTVVPFRYAYIGDFSEGLAPAQDSSTRLWGFIDTAGNPVIPCQYDIYMDGEWLDRYNHVNYTSVLMTFVDGLACVPLDEYQCILINKTGEIVLDRFTMHDQELNIYGEPGTTHQLVPSIKSNYGYSGAGMHWMKKSPGMLTFFDNNGNVKFTTQGDVAWFFSEGLCTVERGTGINERYTNKDKYGVVDDTGRRVIDFKYEFISGFWNGVARFSNIYNSFIDEDGYVDTHGHVLWLPQYSKIQALKVACVCFLVQLLIMIFMILRTKVAVFHQASTHPENLYLPWDIPIKLNESDATSKPPRRLVRAPAGAYRIPRQKTKMPPLSGNCH